MSQSTQVLGIYHFLLEGGRLFFGGQNFLRWSKGGDQFFLTPLCLSWQKFVQVAPRGIIQMGLFQILVFVFHTNAYKLVENLAHNRKLIFNGLLQFWKIVWVTGPSLGFILIVEVSVQDMNTMNTTQSGNGFFAVTSSPVSKYVTKSVINPPVNLPIEIIAYLKYPGMYYMFRALQTPYQMWTLSIWQEEPRVSLYTYTHHHFNIPIQGPGQLCV